MYLTCENCKELCFPNEWGEEEICGTCGLPLDFTIPEGWMKVEDKQRGDRVWVDGKWKVGGLRSLTPSPVRIREINPPKYHIQDCSEMDGHIAYLVGSGTNKDQGSRGSGRYRRVESSQSESSSLMSHSAKSDLQLAASIHSRVVRTSYQSHWSRDSHL